MSKGGFEKPDKSRREKRVRYIHKQTSRTNQKQQDRNSENSKIAAARERDQRLRNRSLRREDAYRMNSHSLQRDTNKVTHEAACNRLLESIPHKNIKRLRADLKATMETMVTVTKAHLQFCHSNGSLMSLPSNVAWIREVKTAHNHANHHAQSALIEIGDPDVETPVPQTPAIKKAKLMSIESWCTGGR